MLPPDLAPVNWSILVVVVGSGAKLAAQDEDRILWTASVGKLFLLVEIARRAAAGDLDLTERVRWRDDELVADSGLWYRLDQRELSVGDLCLLVGAVSDNLATNVLLRLVGVPAVAVTTRALGHRDSALLDGVRRPTRPRRTRPRHPPAEQDRHDR